MAKLLMNKDQNTSNVLFVCSMNQWRSPTAEKVYSERSGIRVRSRGTNKNARQTVSADDLLWADIVLVMESKHQQRLYSQHPDVCRFKDVRVLDIPDNYRYMDDDLIQELNLAIDPILCEFIGPP